MAEFVAATSAEAPPRDPEELERVLTGLPRRELQTLSKSHGVKATLKSETIVGKLMGVLQQTLWPAASVEQEATAVVGVASNVQRKELADESADQAVSDGEDQE
ncbi:hypothetical protein ATCC90586_004841 [Pythium insidiosum]|nr:hypothetical protein ATCC90586_004841 [Pythium insidiosum]